MPRVLLHLEYHGAAYVGWQAQAGLPSVQTALAAAIARATGEDLGSHNLLVAGRTDAGVHARGQRVTFDTRSHREARRFAPALNHFLPRDIRVHLARAVAPDFAVRRAARGKWYRYTVLLGPHPSALYAATAWHVRASADAQLASAALAQLQGSHDFEAFRSAHCDAAHARRTVHLASLSIALAPPIGTLWHIDLVGNAFCRHMCRIFAGSCIDVATGALAPGAMPAALRSLRRADAGQTAPPHGLTLMDVAYPAEEAAAARTRWPPGWPT